jgi:hypothetical protein
VLNRKNERVPNANSSQGVPSNLNKQDNQQKIKFLTHQFGERTKTTNMKQLYLNKLKNISSQNSINNLNEIQYRKCVANQLVQAFRAEVIDSRLTDVPVKLRKI